MFARFALSVLEPHRYWEKKYAEGQFGEKYDWYAAWDSVGETGRSLGEAVRRVLWTSETRCR